MKHNVQKVNPVKFSNNAIITGDIRVVRSCTVKLQVSNVRTLKMKYAIDDLQSIIYKEIYTKHVYPLVARKAGQSKDKEDW